MTIIKPGITRFEGKCAGCGELIVFEWDWANGVIDFGADLDERDQATTYTWVNHNDGPTAQCKQASMVREVRSGIRSCE
jgi:hypothetical protein